jgi:hypothetical protein
MGLDFGRRKPIIICGRGYPSKDFIKYLQDKEIKHVMRVQKRFSPGIDRMRGGGREIRILDGIRTRAIAFRLKSGEREALITNLGGRRDGGGGVPGTVLQATACGNEIQPGETEDGTGNFSGRLADNIKQDFYAMMTVANMPASGLREANEKIPKGKTEQRRYEYRANVNHAVEVLKDRLFGILITDDSFTRKCGGDPQSMISSQTKP